MPLPASASACSATDAMPCAIDVLHREDVDARVADELLLALVEIADADEHGVLGQHLRREAADAATARPAPGRAAPRAACRARCRWRTSPACSCRRARRPRSGRAACSSRAHEVGGRRHRSGGEAVIAAEHERHRALLERRRATSCTASRRRCAISRMYFLLRVADGLGLGNRRDEIALVDDRVCRARPAARRARRCGTPTAPCRRRGGCRRGRAARR